MGASRLGRSQHVHHQVPRYRTDSGLLHSFTPRATSPRNPNSTTSRPRAVNRHLRPDAELWTNGKLYYLELDRGTMGYAQLERRFRLYEGCPDLVLWVCSSQERLDRLRQRAERIRQVALFTTLAAALA